MCAGGSSGGRSSRLCRSAAPPSRYSAPGGSESALAAATAAPHGPGRELLCRRSKVTAPLRLRSEVMGSRGLPLLWRWLDQQDLRQRRFWGPSYPRRRRCGVSGRSRNAAPATPTPTPTSTTAPTPPPRHRQPHRPPRRRRLQRRQLRRAPRPRPHTPTPTFMPHTVGGRLERKEQ